MAVTWWIGIWILSVLHECWPLPHKRTSILEEEPDRVVMVNGRKEYIKNDMGMDREEFIQIFGVDPESEFTKQNRRAALTSDLTLRWTDGVVPYILNKNGFSKDDLEEFHRAIQFISNETCITFRKKTNMDHHGVVIKDCGDDEGCWSHIGMGKAFEDQLVCLSEHCRWFGTVLHEFTHLLGGFHEHERPDRDNWIRIHWDKVDPGDRNQFEKAKADHVVKTSYYDYGSIMHYDRSTFSKDGKSKTISALNPANNKKLFPVEFKTYSYFDVKLLNEQYQCAAHCPKIKCTGFVNKDCKCVTQSAYRRTHCWDEGPDCKEWAQDGDCDSDSTWYMSVYCRKACGWCN